MTGAGLDAKVVVMAVLFAGFGSGVVELTVAVLLIITPSATEQFTCAASVIVAVAFTGNEGNEIVRLLLEPPLQVPPATPLTEHETKEVTPGKLSVTVTDDASVGPLFFTVIV